MKKSIWRVRRLVPVYQLVPCTESISQQDRGGILTQKGQTRKKVLMVIWFK